MVHRIAFWSCFGMCRHVSAFLAVPFSLPLPQLLLRDVGARRRVMKGDAKRTEDRTKSTGAVQQCLVPPSPNPPRPQSPSAPRATSRQGHPLTSAPFIGLAVRFWQVGIEMRPFFNKESLWAYPVYALGGASFGYWLQGVDERQAATLSQRKTLLLEKRARKAARDADGEAA